jgi:hypothetical protein
MDIKTYFAKIVVVDGHMHGQSYNCVLLLYLMIDEITLFNHRDFVYINLMYLKPYP